MLELDDWLSYRELNRGQSLSTINNYRRRLLHFDAWLQMQGLDVAAVQPEDVQRYAGAELHRSGLSASSRRVAVSALRGYYRHLVQRRHLRVNPAELLPYPKTGRALPLPIPLRDAEKILAQPDLDTLRGVRDLALLALLIGCGPRVSGLTAMNERDLFFSHDDNGIEELTIRLCEKGRRERLVPAPEEARIAVRAYLGHPELDLIDRRLPDGDEVLFVNLSNTRVASHEHRGQARRISTWSVHQMVRRYGEECGIDTRLLHPHAFRHLYGAELAEGDIDLEYRQRLMGHADPKSTTIYSHVAYRKLRRAMADANPLRRIKSPMSGLAAALKAGVR